MQVSLIEALNQSEYVIDLQDTDINQKALTTVLKNSSVGTMESLMRSSDENAHMLAVSPAKTTPSNNLQLNVANI